MRIIQITDIHIAPENADSFEIDTRANFIRILEETKRLNPDQIVITGDFCFRDPQPAIYEWVKARLAEQEMNIELISGNHDDPKVLAAAFGRTEDLHDDVIYFRRNWAGRAVFFLDSTVGTVSSAQLDWLRAQLKQTKGRVLVFVHHPPVNAGVPHMDHNFNLKNGEALMDILVAYGQPVNVYSGHYHVEKTINRANVTVQITPSCFVQIDQYEQDFKADHHRIALRVITLREKEILSTVHYFDGQ
jgi:Icc protein